MPPANAGAQVPFPVTEVTNAGPAQRPADSRFPDMTLLDSWALGEHTAGALAVRRVGDAAGFTVVMPHLFGTPEKPMSIGYVAGVVPRVCVSKEFTTMAAGRTSPIAGWLRSLARDLHDELGGSGVGALGMCFTGGFALAMMVDTSVVAPVVAQPSLPFAVGRRRAADLNLSPADLAAVKDRVAGGCEVLGLRYREDAAVGTRFDTLTRELGDGFIRVEFEGKKHSTLTAHRQQEGVDRVLAFFEEKLKG
jgi:dienelactone hydrolase